MQRGRAAEREGGLGWRGQSGQAVLLLVASMAAVLVGAVLLGGIAKGIGKGGREQRAADLGALAGARAMREAYTRLFEPPDFEGHANPRHLEVGAYKDLGRDAALGVARVNGARNVAVGFPDGDSFAPTRIRVTVRDPAKSDAGGHHHEAAIRARADAELAPPAQIGLPLTGGDGEYPGPFGSRTTGQATHRSRGPGSSDPGAGCAPRSSVRFPSPSASRRRGPAVHRGRDRLPASAVRRQQFTGSYHG